MSDEERRTNILLEQLMSQFRTFGEGLDGLRNEVNQFRIETDAKFNKLETRMDRLDGKLSQMQESNDRDHQQIIQAVYDLDSEIPYLIFFYLLVPKIWVILFQSDSLSLNRAVEPKHFDRFGSRIFFNTMGSPCRDYKRDFRFNREFLFADLGQA